jgi:hypothetical protein
VSEYKCKLVGQCSIVVEPGLFGSTKARVIEVEKRITLPFPPYPNIIIDGILFDICQYVTKAESFVLRASYFPCKGIPEGFTQVNG